MSDPIRFEMFGVPAAGKTTLRRAVALRRPDLAERIADEGPLCHDISGGAGGVGFSPEPGTVYLYVDTPVGLALGRNLLRDGQPKDGPAGREKKRRPWGREMGADSPALADRYCLLSARSLAAFGALRAAGVPAYRLCGSGDIQRQVDRIIAMAGPPAYATRAQFMAAAESARPVDPAAVTHWETAARRWEYHALAIEALSGVAGVTFGADVLEVGTCGAQIVSGGAVMDYSERWRFDGMQVDFQHDACQTPWPFVDREFRACVALRVFHHLAPAQSEAFREAARVADYVVIICPVKGRLAVAPETIDGWAGGPPLSSTETPFGPLRVYRSRCANH